MKKRQIVALALGLSLIAVPVLAETEVMEKTTSTTYSGTVTELNPSTSTIILRSQQSTEPMSYSFTKETTFVDPQGNTVAMDVLKNTPVTVYYTKDGGRMTVTKVVTTKPATELRKETTTTTEKRTIE